MPVMSSTFFRFTTCFISILLLVLCFTVLRTNDTYFQYAQSISSLSSSLCINSSVSNTNAHPVVTMQDKTYTYFHSFNTTNPHKDTWCPFATCQNSPMCFPCNRRYLFILATGRSASTTLLKMLNYLPNVRLSGENLNLLYVASKIISNFKGEKVAHLLDQNFDRVEGAYLHNAIPPQVMSCPIQQVINTLNPPPQKVQKEVNLTGHPSIEEYDRDRILGVKTIRFHKGEWSIGEASQFLKQNFPCSRVVVNIRSDIQSQLKSLNSTFSSAQNYVKGAEFIKGMNDFLVGVEEELGIEMARLIDMTEWTKNVEILNDLIHWLGYRDCRYANIVHENTNGFGRDHETMLNLGNHCRYVG
mmetsp:Transcript_2075/g.3770  ORF Transcript_2075/g.3770 Transcript_2075/m.3770 type:complete len:358 (-) Transcript_2075:1014-2087(-)